MNLKPKFWNADKIVSFSAILISLATMGVYIYQTHLIQKQQGASVLPYLMIGTSSYNPGHFVVQLSNDGLGPAMIEEVNVYFHNKKYQDCDIPTFFWRKNPIKKDSTLMNGVTYGNIGKGQLIPANKTLNLIEISENKQVAKSLSGYFWETEKPVELEIVFASIYGEKWSVKGVVSRPKKIED
jgi:hypothetical protein